MPRSSAVAELEPEPEPGPTGIAIPRGSPADLKRAASAWGDLAELIDGTAGLLERASATVVDADWHGDASRGYARCTAVLTIGFMKSATTCRDAQRACRRLATTLHHTQLNARAAQRKAADAIRRRDAAAVAGTDDHVREAQIEEAENDLRLARRDGEQAMAAAERAGREAAHVLSSVATAAAPPISFGPPPVPVSLNGTDPTLAGSPGFGGPFRAPGRYASPAEARAVQIARQRAAAAGLTEDAKPGFRR